MSALTDLTLQVFEAEFVQADVRVVDQVVQGHEQTVLHALVVVQRLAPDDLQAGQRHMPGVHPHNQHVARHLLYVFQKRQVVVAMFVEKDNFQIARHVRAVRVGQFVRLVAETRVAPSNQPLGGARTH